MYIRRDELCDEKTCTFFVMGIKKKKIGAEGRTGRGH